MKILKEKKGFTLIELLAVIVILAVVAVIGATTVLPYIQNANERAFAVEANQVKDAASQAVSLIQIGSLTSNFEDQSTSSAKVYCFTLENLVDAGLWTKDKGSIYNEDSNANGNYKGTVTATQSGNAYTYSVSMTDGSLYVSGESGNINSGAVHKTSEQNSPTIANACS